MRIVRVGFFFSAQRTRCASSERSDWVLMPDRSMID